jgi:hypothetical protein
LTPQPPQLSGSVPVKVQLLPQAIAPDGQTQRPAEQLLPPVHALPQAPQLSGSFCTLMQPF